MTVVAGFPGNLLEVSLMYIYEHLLKILCLSCSGIPTPPVAATALLGVAYVVKRVVPNIFIPDCFKV